MIHENTGIDLMNEFPGVTKTLALRPIFGHLVRGREYFVTQPFFDYDQDLHEPGEIWTFLGSSYLSYDDDLCLFVLSGNEEYQIRLQWRESEQGEIITNLHDYVMEYSVM